MFTAWKELSISAFLLSTCLDCTSVHAVERLPAKGPVAASGEVPTGAAKEFINFSLSSQITDIVPQHDYLRRAGVVYTATRD